MTYSEFERKEHQKRVNHFKRFIASSDRKVTIQDAIEIFGFCEKDASPIYIDAIAQSIYETYGE